MAREQKAAKAIRNQHRGTRQWLAVKLHDSSMMSLSATTRAALAGTTFSVPAQATWENEDMSWVRRVLLVPRFQATVIAGLIVALAFVIWITPPHAVVMHNILHHLNILPFMLSGLIFGWRGALKALLFAAVLQTPAIHRHWYHAPLDSQDQIVELSIFGAAGVIAGVIADRERMQRQRVETTKLELELVYTELRENIQQMKKSERLTAAGQLSASLAHEIRNPLASISGAAGILARGQAPAASREECLDILMKESQRLNKLLTNFLDFARPRLPKYQWTDPTAVIQSVVTLTQHIATQQNVTLEIESPLRLPEIECDAEQIKQVLLNLLLNAIQATESRGKIVIRSFSMREDLCIEIVDHGPGIAPADVDHIFDPFFTTKENGTGLGLAIAANIISQHGGSLTCRPNEGNISGMTFAVQLPLERPQTMHLTAMQKKAATT